MYSNSIIASLAAAAAGDGSPSNLTAASIAAIIIRWFALPTTAVAITALVEGIEMVVGVR